MVGDRADQTGLARAGGPVEEVAALVGQALGGVPGRVGHEAVEVRAEGVEHVVRERHVVEGLGVGDLAGLVPVSVGVVAGDAADPGLGLGGVLEVGDAAEDAVDLLAGHAGGREDREAEAFLLFGAGGAGLDAVAVADAVQQDVEVPADGEVVDAVVDEGALELGELRHLLEDEPAEEDEVGVAAPVLALVAEQIQSRSPPRGAGLQPLPGGGQQYGQVLRGPHEARDDQRVEGGAARAHEGAQCVERGQHVGETACLAV